MWRCLERSKGVRARLRIVECKRRDNARSSHTRLCGEICHDRLPKRRYVVRHESGARKQQRQRAYQHVHARQSRGDRGSSLYIHSFKSLVSCFCHAAKLTVEGLRTPTGPNAKNVILKAANSGLKDLSCVSSQRAATRRCTFPATMLFVPRAPLAADRRLA